MGKTSLTAQLMGEGDRNFVCEYKYYCTYLDLRGDGRVLWRNGLKNSCDGARFLPNGHLSVLCSPNSVENGTNFFEQVSFASTGDLLKSNVLIVPHEAVKVSDMFIFQGREGGILWMPVDGQEWKLSGLVYKTGGSLIYPDGGEVKSIPLPLLTYQGGSAMELRFQLRLERSSIPSTFCMKEDKETIRLFKFEENGNVRTSSYLVGTNKVATVFGAFDDPWVVFDKGTFKPGTGTEWVCVWNPKSGVKQEIVVPVYTQYQFGLVTLPEGDHIVFINSYAARRSSVTLNLGLIPVSGGKERSLTFKIPVPETEND